MDVGRETTVVAESVVRVQDVEEPLERGLGVADRESALTSEGRARSDSDRPLRVGPRALGGGYGPRRGHGAERSTQRGLKS